MSKIASRNIITSLNLYFTERLRTRRMELGLSLADLDKTLCRSPGSTSRLETGKRKPDVCDLAGLAEILGVSTGYFYEGFNQANDLKEYGAPSQEFVGEVEKFLSVYYQVGDETLRQDILKMLRITASSPVYGDGGASHKDI